MIRSFFGAFTDRYRRPLAFTGVIAGVLLTVVLYNWSAPRPSSVGGGDAPAVPEGMIIKVGALPVT